MAQAAPTTPIADAARGPTYILSDGVSQRVIQPGHRETVQAVAGRRYKLMRMDAAGAKPVADVIAVADGGTDDGHLHLMTGDHTEIVIRDFFKMPDTRIDIPRPEGDTLTLDKSTSPLSRGADGSDLVGMAGTRSGLGPLAQDFAGHFDVLSADRFATALVWSGALESAAPAPAAASFGGILGSTVGSAGTATVFGSSGLAVGVGALAGVGAVIAGVAGASGSSSSSSTSTNSSTNTTTTTDPLAPEIAVETISGDYRINASEYTAIVGTKNAPGPGLTVSGGTLRVENGNILTVKWAGLEKQVAVVNGTWSVTFPANEIPVTDGDYSISVHVKNAAGKEKTETHSLPIDRTAAISIDPITADGVLSASELNSGITLTGTTDIEDGRSISVSVGDTKKTVTAASGRWSAAFSKSELPTQSGGTFFLSGTDAAGNEAMMFASVVYDLTASVGIDAISGNDKLNAAEIAAGAIVVSGTSSGIEAGRTVAVTWGGVSREATIDSNNHWSVTFVTADVPVDGVSSITASATDKAGNPASASHSLTIDRVAPTIAINAIATDNIVNATEAAANVAITGTTDAANGAVVTVIWNNVNHTGSVTNGTWTATFSSGEVPTDGPYSISATVNDAAGNTGSAAQSVTVDKTAPTIAISDVATDNIVSSAEKSAGVTISGTTNAADASSVIVSWGGKEKTAAVAGGVWSVTYASTDVPADGTTQVTATVSDAAGNAAVPAQRSVLVSEIPILTLVGSAIAGIKITGEGNAAFDTSYIGDVNGDGLADILVSAPQADPSGRNNAGRSYVVFGHSGNTPIALSDVVAGNGGFVIDGKSAGDISGWTVAGIGDMNHDGLADLAIGTNNAAGGPTYVIWGKTDGGAIDLNAPTGNWGFTVQGQQLFANVSSAGDVNGDGTVDLMVSQRDYASKGRIYIIYGGNHSGTIQLSDIAAGTGGYIIEGNGNQSGVAIADTGDVNGDGLSDIIIGTPTAAGGSGAAYVVFGATSSIFGPTFFDQLGGSGADTLTDAGVQKSLAGGEGNDIIRLSAASVAYGGAGNDTFEIADQAVITALASSFGNGGNTAQLARIDGGSGIDTLKLTGSGLNLDLGSITNRSAGTALDGLDRLSSIEIIDITGTGDNTLTLSLHDVLDLAGSNIFTDADGFGFGGSVPRHQMIVKSDAADHVILSDQADWFSGGTVTMGGTTYTAYVAQNAFAVLYLEHLPVL